MKNFGEQINEGNEKNPYEIFAYSLNKMPEIVQLLRGQIDDEYEYGTLVQVFGGVSPANNGKIFSAMDGEKIMGIGAVSLDENQDGTLEAIYVSKDYRDKGIGANITKGEINYLIGMGVKKIIVNVTSRGGRETIASLKGQYGDIIEIKDHGDYFE